MSLVEKNQYGYWERSDERLGGCCVLLAILNTLQAMYKMNDNYAQLIAERFFKLATDNPKLEFASLTEIPMTIEKITCGKFYGKLMCPTARSMIINPDPRYSREVELNSENIFRYALDPMVAVYKPNGKWHAISIKVVYNQGRDMEIVDNGLITDVRLRQGASFVIPYGYKLIQNPSHLWEIGIR
jgi:hypothetical protein